MFSLTREGKYIARLSNRSWRNLLLFKKMLKRVSFHKIVSRFDALDRDLASLNGDVLAPIIQRYAGYNETTARRRASTVMSWLRSVSGR